MNYTDIPDESALKAYVRQLNARAKHYKIRHRLSVAAVRDIVLESGGVCAWCGQSVVNLPFELDHVIPLSDKGAHSVANLVLSCEACNRRKASLHPATFAQSLAVLLGTSTPLIARVLAHYGVVPLRQDRLF